MRLDNLDQRGGGAISVQTRDGGIFDAIVFGEQEAGIWMAGSEFFRRYQSVGGQTENEAVDRAVHVAIIYAADGTIRVYRDGRPYGTPYKSSGPVAFPAGETQVVFGLRHAPAGGNRMLAGTIVRARVYDRALDEAEVAASAASVRRLRRSRGDQRRPDSASAAPSARGSWRDRDAAVVACRSRAQGVRRVAARSGRDARADPGESRPARRSRVGRRRRGDRRAREPTSAWRADAPEARRRERLAAWISSPRNPLFARVVVNRLWQAHFGTGLVETSSDLGFNGGAPSHPELLDWLAAEMVAQGWSLKSMHRLIVTSAAYRQSSRLDAQGARRDAGDRLLWRKAPMRLEAEMVRDAMLAVSGVLDPKLGGPSFRDQEVVKAPGHAGRPLRGGRPRNARARPADALPRLGPRRPQPVARRVRLPRSIDDRAPPRRHDHAAPGAVAHEQRSGSASVRRLRRAVGARGRARRRPAGRARLPARVRPCPEPDERARAASVVEQFGAATLARAIFNSNEFLYLD